MHRELVYFRAMVPTQQPQFDRREIFVAEYLVDRDPRRAAEAAGYARATGSALLKDEDIAEAIRAGQQRQVEQAGVHATHVLKHTASIAFLDMREGFGPNGEALLPHQWSETFARAVNGFEVVEKCSPEGEVTRTYKVKLPDKNSAAERLFKHLGLYERDNAQQATGGLADLVAYIQQRGSRLQVGEAAAQPVVIENAAAGLAGAAKQASDARIVAQQPAPTLVPGAHLV